MNKHDSEVMAGYLAGAGFTESPSMEEADLVLINTCTVRGHAENRAGSRGSDMRYDLIASKVDGPR